MGHQSDNRPSFFRRLAQDITANTIVISAASLVPLMAMVGGGVDASRYYMAETRLQAACDAGALAARRSMPAKVLDDESKTIGNNFFDENYPDGTFGLEQLNRAYVADSDGEVSGTASGTLPTAMMGAFGYDEFQISVECSADVNVSNTDIMFVLDVTGSMNCTATDTSCTNNGEVEASGSKIDNLRTSVMTFYDTVEGATSNKATVRYGVVPYNSQVNVGASLNDSWMATSHSYQSREPIWNTTWTTISYDVDDPDSTTGVEEFDEFQWTHYGEVSEYWCEYYMDILLTDSFDWRPTSSGTPSASSGTVTSQTQNGDIRTTTGYHETTLERREKTYIFTPGAGDDQCHLGYNWYTMDVEQDYTLIEEQEQEFDEYRYYQRTFDLTSLYDDDRITFDTGTEGADEIHQWNGCIEEANTVSNSTFDPVPSGAYDLDIDLVPSLDDEKWAPALPDLVHYRYDYNWYWTTSQYYTTRDYDNPRLTCPKAAMRLQEITARSDLEDYLAEVPPSGSSETEGMIAWGSTYHDIGMIWGGRFISPDGIFAADNATTAGGDAISRHIVFMTDGTQSTSRTTYNVYGIEWWDRRVSGDGSSTTLSNNHAERFQAACRAARNKNISVWVVAFGTTLTQNLIDCATPGRAFSASNGTELDEKFREIAERIAELRLTD